MNVWVHEIELGNASYSAPAWVTGMGVTHHIHHYHHVGSRVDNRVDKSGYYESIMINLTLNVSFC